MNEFVEGQRWISQSEPELGLGTVVRVGQSRVEILFPAAGELRHYVPGQAPLKRARFRSGDLLQSRDNQPLTVESVREVKGLIVYVGQGREVPEAQLSDRISFHGPEERLWSGHFDEIQSFALRRRAWQHLHRSRQSSVRGFVGGRIDLIPHQLYLAHEVSSRFAPRVLLSDEVGLGKTIEACLILHRLLVSGRVGRLLVVVPESLVHQWYVEMLRRFNVPLCIFDEDRCQAIEAGQPGSNPFLDDQLVLCSLGFLAGSSRRAAQAAEAGWDILVVDEAHHLEWAPGLPSPAYTMIESLSHRAEGLLLLTATPEPLGLESHFARLRLLDPDRYGDFDAFQRESAQFHRVARIAGKLQNRKPLTSKEAEFLKTRVGHATEVGTMWRQGQSPGQASNHAASQVLDQLLDLHGPGRVVFRNTRAAMSGFPKRIPHLVPIEPRARTPELTERLLAEFCADVSEAGDEFAPAFEGDTRIDWLVGLLRKVAPHKVLLICRSPAKVLAIERALRLKVNLNLGVFHEGLTLMQRDRNAAWFASEEDVRLLLCSEIGGEGRNFQFVHHLVLFDLPPHPDQLEQRIGRLDRIGQKRDIQLHVPYVKGSPQEVLSRWYQEGLNAFASSLEGGAELWRQFGKRVHALALGFASAPGKKASGALSSLIKQTNRAREQLVKRLERGRDRLLEMNSFRPQTARVLVEAIGLEDQDTRLEAFMMEVFEHFGVHAEEWAPHTYHLNAQGAITDAFPSIPAHGLVATFERKRALEREDVGFLTWDHPMVTGAIDLILGSELGNCSVAFWPGSGERALWVEAMFVLETVAERRLHVDRFLPPTPIRVLINETLADVSDPWPARVVEPQLRRGHPYPLLDEPDLRGRVLPAMIQSARQAAEGRAQSLTRAGMDAMRRMLDHEVERLRWLRKVNDHVRPQEIELAEQHRDLLARAIGQSRLRLDAVRLIVKGPAPGPNPARKA